MIQPAAGLETRDTADLEVCATTLSVAMGLGVHLQVVAAFVQLRSGRKIAFFVGYVKLHITDKDGKSEMLKLAEGIY